MSDDAPIPRDGKLNGWRLPPGTQGRSPSDDPNACPFCKTEVQPLEGAWLGQTGTGESASPEPWQVVADCPKCGAHLVRIPGDPWTGTVPM